MAIEQMRTALWNEKVAPELLGYQHDLVLQIKDKILDQQDTVDSLDKKDKLLGCLYQMEIDRVKFLLASYLRVRLHKIESNIFYYIKAPGSDALSLEEMSYAKNYATIFQEHLQDCVLKDIPAQCSGLNCCLCVRFVNAHAASLSRFVCISANEDIGRVEVGDRGDLNDQDIPVNKDDTVIVRYSKIQELLASRKVKLI